MLYFTVDPRDNSGSDGCNTCCCAAVSMRPGETNKFQINYAPWAVPIIGRGLGGTAISIVQKVSPPIGANQPPIVTDGLFPALFNTPLNGDLSTLVTNPDADILTYAILPLYTPKHGAIALNAANGTFVYTPVNGFTGYDEFFFSVSDGVNPPVVAQAIVAVGPDGGPALPAIPFTPHISVPQDRIAKNSNYFFIDFPVIVSPAAVVGAIYRMEVLQQTLDCDLNVFTHLSCYDITISKC